MKNCSKKLNSIYVWNQNPAWRLAHFSFVACLQMLSQMLLGDGRQSRIGLLRQYPEVALSYMYVLFNGAWLVFQSVSNW